MGDCICVRRGDGPEGCGICNETGTTPDIAGLCERMRVALEPFALAADNMDGDEPDSLFIYDSPESTMIDYADLRRARAALTTGEEK